MSVTWLKLWLKSAELSERLRRAEDIIREALRSATIYYRQCLSIKEKDERSSYRSIESSCRTRILSIRGW